MNVFKSYFTPISEQGESSRSSEQPQASTAPSPSTDRKRRPSFLFKQTQVHGQGAQAAGGSERIVETSLASSGPSSSHSASFPQGPNATPELLSVQNAPAGSSGSAGSKSTGPSRSTSIRGSSQYPPGDFRNSTNSLLDIRTDMMVKWLYEQQLRKQYTSGHAFEGIVLKKARGDFTCSPPAMASIPNSLYHVVRQMNVRCAMTINTPVVRAIMDSASQIIPDGMSHFPLPDGLRIQVLRTMSDLPKGQLHHFAAFVEDTRLLVVWDDEPEKLFTRAQLLESKLVEIIWGSGNAEIDEDEKMDEKKGTLFAQEEVNELDPAALEEALAREHRPIRLMSALHVALTLALCLTCLGTGWRWLAMEVAVDGDYTRLALVALTPVHIFVSLFFFQALFGNLIQIFGPISAVTSNSKYYSGVPPKRLNRNTSVFPHVTIQMPVYKEGLSAVIKPTVHSLKAAISTFEMQGGSANIFVNDDGMQLISEEDAQARRDFYDEHNIGWVARPAHRPKPNLELGEKKFLRRGKFKKASNMNYALMVSNRVEEKLTGVARSARWTQEQETAAYEQCLAEILQEDEGRTWAEGNIRVGDYILLIDSDTRVPHDCLLDAVSEMEQSPEVAIIQFSSGVMNVTDSYFEKGVTWFTNLIYSAITFSVAAGDACPFVGHNAMLRWRAIQDAAPYTDEDGYEKFWSESHVSEDFDMALRMQVAGYSLRYAAYTGDGFKEGVSLTVYDELARWEKYAYGCNELLFHPFRFWPVRGPFTPLFRRFLFSCIPFPKKLTILGYVGTYYAIGASWSLTILNYFLTGWFYGMYDKYYLDSFAIYISIIVVFTGLGNVALAVLRYRLSEKSLPAAFLENLMWIPMFTIFLGGISIHVSQALLSHFFEIDMAWGATAKEAEKVNFGEEMFRILRRFKYTFLFCFAATGLMVAGWFFFPPNWRIQTFFSIYPLATVVFGHFCLPVLLNPALMMFSW